LLLLLSLLPPLVDCCMVRPHLSWSPFAVIAAAS
jgi:hypothetical protein